MNKVQCPVCSKEIPLNSINAHLDLGCSAKDDSPTLPLAPSQPKAPAQSKPPGKVASIFQTPAKRSSAQVTGGAQRGGGGSNTVASVSSGGNISVNASQTVSPGRGGAGPVGLGKRSIFHNPSGPPGPATVSGGDSVLDRDADLDAPTVPPFKKQKTSTEKLHSAMPLAEKMRPKSLDDIYGQDLVGPKGVLRGLIEKERVPSMILWGSAGSGKTTIARVIAGRTKARFVEISATNAGVNECKKIFQEAKAELLLTGRRTILFCDEIHRFSKSQQDVFLAPVESGQITLIGATTENPSFKIQSALLSRCRVFTLAKLTSYAITNILRRALTSESPLDPVSKKPIMSPLLDDEMLEYLALFSDGDARTALNLLELAMSLAGRDGWTKEDVKKALTRTLVYDQSGDMHYDAISAFHKSVRGGDADAALYWLGRMLAGGEDPLYIARRMIVIASEDVGVADNTLLPLATATYTAVQAIGLPEARINLAHCTVALAEAKKSVRVYRGIGKLMQNLENDPVAGGAPVPVHLRNAPTRLMKELGYGKEYKYNPDYVNGEVLQEYLPEKLKGSRFLEDEHLGRKRDPDLDRLRGVRPGDLERLETALPKDTAEATQTDVVDDVEFDPDADMSALEDDEDEDKGAQCAQQQTRPAG